MKRRMIAAVLLRILVDTMGTVRAVVYHAVIYVMVTMVLV